MAKLVLQGLNIFSLHCLEVYYLLKFIGGVVDFFVSFSDSQFSVCFSHFPCGNRLIGVMTELSFLSELLFSARRAIDYAVPQ